MPELPSGMGPASGHYKLAADIKGNVCQRCRRTQCMSCTHAWHQVVGSQQQPLLAMLLPLTASTGAAHRHSVPTRLGAEGRLQGSQCVAPQCCRPQ